MDAKFSVWLDTLREDVIQNEFGYEPADNPKAFGPFAREARKYA